MKKFKTIIIFVAVAGLAFLAYRLATNTSGSKMATEALSDFAIKDTASIDKLILTDTDGSPGVTVVRKGTKWELESGDCIQNHLIHTLLETIKYIKVKSPVPEGSIETINKTIAAHHKKMEIYQNGQLKKTWYVGDPTQDQYGTYMLLKDPEKGKSPEPFIMHLPNMYGNLSTRFITNAKDFGCTEVFVYQPENIGSVEVTIPDSTQFNFKIVALAENTFTLYNNETLVENFDTTRVRDYLVGFKKIHFERYPYDLTPENIDSLKSGTPYFTINVTTKADESNKIRIFRRRYTFEKYGLNGELLEYDQDRVWVELNSGEIVIGQFFVFGKLLRDIRFFQDYPG